MGGLPWTPRFSSVLLPPVADQPQRRLVRMGIHRNSTRRSDKRPHSALNAPGGLVAFARGADNAIWHAWQDQPGGNRW
jgi:hypothetical protein